MANDARDAQSSSSPGSEEHDADMTWRLLDAARAGDDEALESLFGRYSLPLRRWASGRLPRWARDMSDTQDLVQDVLLQTFTKLGTFEYRGRGALQAYLRQAVLNRIRDEFRRRSRRPDSTDLNERLVDEGLSPLDAAIGSETVDRYEAALARLKCEERDAIVARIELGFSYADIAESLGKPSADAARKAVTRALARLAEEMNTGGGTQP